MVSGVGYNPAKRVAGGNYSGVALKKIITNLCVMDFGGTDNAVRVVSLHPGVTFQDVQAATGFPLEKGDLVETSLPDADALAIIAQLDPHNIRASVIKDNPPAQRVS
jgi:glutaconate CoA-transferase subunit B